MKAANILLFTHQTDVIEAVSTSIDSQIFQALAYQAPTDLITQNQMMKATKNRPGEPTEGADANIFAAIVELQAAIILIDLDNPAVNWKKWMPILKSSPATRRSPIIVWSETLNSDSKTVARSRGAEVAVTKEVFMRDVAKIISKKALIVDHVGIKNACAEPLAPLALKGLELFNKKEYFDCHEELEHAWNADKGPARELYRGVLQVAVAYLQIERGNYNGAIKMLMRVKQWLDPLPDTCRGIDVSKLRQDADAVYQQLKELGRDRLDEFDQSTFQPVSYEII
ncbi:MAG: DUF309 domain-containing protein [Anaerolineae bacterium]